MSGGTDNDTIAWADVVLGAGVVTNALGITYDSNLTQTDFYRSDNFKMHVFDTRVCIY